MDKDQNKDIFEKLKRQILNLDPVAFCEEYLTLDGKQFSLHNGYRPLIEIYRYAGIKILEPNSKPLIIVKGRQSGMSTMASAIQMFLMGNNFHGTNGNPPMRILHAFPYLELSAVYSKTKLNQMIVQSKNINSPTEHKGTKPVSYMQSLLDRNSASSESLHFKSFQNGNHLFIDSIGLTGDRVMGRTADYGFYDEVQSTTGQAIGNSSKIFTTAKYGIPGKGSTCYFGTPRKKGSDFHKMWMRSSQQYFYLNCEKCKEYFPLYSPENNNMWESVWIHTFVVKCPHCSHEQDKIKATDRGKWVSLKDPHDQDCDMIGFHVSQLLMPSFSREDMEKEKPGISVINTERMWANEIMGYFFDGDTSPITPEEIRELCGDQDRKFSASIAPAQDELVVMGLDYGLRNDLEQLADKNNTKAQGQSYSTAVVLKSTGPGLLSIEFCTKFKRNDQESKKGIIDQLMRTYGVKLAIGDIGYSNDLSYDLHQTYGDRYLVSRAVNKIKDNVQYINTSLPKEIMFARDHYIRELFEQMKKGMIRFPYADFEKINWLILHCSSMEIKPSISKYGDHSIHYVKGSTPNDGFMALLNAYIAYRFLVSQGFSNNDPGSNHNPNLNKPRILGAHIKRYI